MTYDPPEKPPDRKDVDAAAHHRFWQVRRVPAQGPDDFVRPVNRRLFKWWASFEPDIPRRADFDPLDHARSLSHVFLFEILDEMSVVRRLSGEDVIALLGDRERFQVYRTDSRRADERELVRYLLAVAGQRRPMRCFGSIPYPGREFLNFESVDCPLRAANDDTIRYVIGSLDLLPDQD